MGTKLTAKSGSVAGDAFDKVLDEIQAKLKTAGKKLSDIAGDLAKSGGSGDVLFSDCPPPAGATLRNRQSVRIAHWRVNVILKWFFRPARSQ